MRKFVFIIMTALMLFSLLSCAAPEKKTGTIFYPPLPQQPRLQFLKRITTEEDIGKTQNAFEEFLVGKTPLMKAIGRPYDIGTVNGKIYISDRTYKKILIIDLVKQEFDYIKADREGALSEPLGIWVTDDDIKYVADIKRRQIVVFNRNNKFLRAYGKADQFTKPVDVAVYGNRIYVCDIEEHKIFVVDKNSGETIQEIGKLGAGEGEFYKPSHIKIDKENNLFVNDSFNFRIQKFGPDGKFMKIIGYQGSALGGFARPKGFDIDKEGHLFATDVAFENIQVFDSNDAELLLFFGQYGVGPGSLYMPNSLHVDYHNLEYFSKYADKDFKIRYLVFVGNMLGENKLNIYGFGEWTGAPLPEMENRRDKKGDGKEKEK